MKSLQDQLLKSGLADKQSLKKVKKEGQKGQKKPKGRRTQISETAKQAEQTRIEKLNRDKALNLARQQAVEEKAKRAQIAQLIQSSKIDRNEGEVAYNFTHSKADQKTKIRKIYVTTEQQAQLSRGQICVVLLGLEQYELVPKVVADKIAAHAPEHVVKVSSSEKVSEEDDPYADYQIPDDIIW